MKNKLVLFFSLSIAIFYSQKDTTVLNGFNYGRNLIVLNPFNADGNGYCITEVIINNSNALVNIQSSLFEIDFSKNKLKLNEKLNIKIIHSVSCTPIIYNAECIVEKNIEIINSLDSNTKNNNNYALKDKSICIITGKLNFEKKPKDVFDYMFGYERLSNNLKNKERPAICMGNPDEDGRYIGVLAYNDLYSVDLDFFGKGDTTKIAYRFLVDLRGIPEDKKRGQLINLDIFVKDNIDDRLYKLNEEFPTKKLYYNSFNQALMWDKDYENVITKTLEVLSKQISQENNVKVLELEKKSEKKQKIYLYLILLVIFLITIVSIFAFFRQRKLKKLVDIKKIEVEEQKHLLEEKQKDILDSIRYAKRIQQSLMAPEKQIDKTLNRLKK